jgi:hypothetical protein
MSSLEIHGYSTEDGVLGFIAIPTFIREDLMCAINLSISASEDRASMWKQKRSQVNGGRRLGGTGPGLREYFYPLIRIGDHHMAVEEGLGFWNCVAEGSYYWRTHCDVWDCRLETC